MTNAALTRLTRLARSRARSLAVRFGGLPHSVGTVDSPPAPVAADVTSLWRRNLTSKKPVVDAAHPEVVTMTTHGDRLRDVWLAIESIGRGAYLPGRIILWLDHEAGLPWRLRRLRKRGLEVKYVEAGWGVHTKYWPYVSTQAITGPLITADDDIIYPPNWLGDLSHAHRAHPDDVIAFRAHTVGMSTPSVFAPYTTWLPCLTTEPRYSNFATSVSGQLIPPALQRHILGEGTAFTSAAPTADDVWLHRCAVTFGFATRQVEETPLHWWFIPGSQVSGLNAQNVIGGANDRQMQASHTSQTRARLWNELRAGSQTNSMSA
ncbi:hypothetical protein N3K63_00495 [Microbacterium sp. W1N]|uniref:hypothetical protein n=1 Tax=Microbacterium festucae TaxID=2977531 RepID=UPI0021BE131C|nr:hypothetical protein [Microbacterium festucae]MCT9818754.1 hypothetical protein [Microbacterium festucae]